MKKRIITIVSLMICFVLSGCCLSHEWSEATCSAPKTCQKCGETEGEALEHEWVEATCSAPKTCNVCEKTEGEALPHTLSEATYQQASICEVCNVMVGEPLEADFEKYGLADKFVELNKEYDCVVKCHNDDSQTTVGKITFSNYQTFISGLPEKNGWMTITTELPEEAGYEYRVLDVNILFSDENAINYGAEINSRCENYYDIKGMDDSTVRRKDGWNQFTVNWNGEDYTECLSISFGEWNPTDNGFMFSEFWVVRVPVGYDGLSVGYRNSQIVIEDGQYIYEVDNTDSVFYRME